MRHIRLNGHNVQTVGYDAATRRMEATFVHAPGWVYTYHRVPLSLYGEVVLAERPGPVFSQKIRSRPDVYPYVRKRL
jgi:hypothetical protein